MTCPLAGRRRPYPGRRGRVETPGVIRPAGSRTHGGGRATPAVVLAEAAKNLYSAQMQMAVRPGWHIVFSCLGVAFPAMVMFAGGAAPHRRPSAARARPHVAKAVGCCSPRARCRNPPDLRDGHLWPGLMNTYGEIFRFPFVSRASRLHRGDLRRHLPVGLEPPVAARTHPVRRADDPRRHGGTFFVVAANAWMNNPVGFDVAPDGSLTNINPIRGSLPDDAPAGRPMSIAAFMAPASHRVGLRRRHAARSKDGGTDGGTGTTTTGWACSSR